MKEKLIFERLNLGWNADPNAPEVNIQISGNDVIVRFFPNTSQYSAFSEGDIAVLTFHDCLKYRYGSPNDEGFYFFGESRYRSCGVEWGNFYLVRDSNPNDPFPDTVYVSDQRHDDMKHYLFYFRDGTFECFAGDYDLRTEHGDRTDAKASCPYCGGKMVSGELRNRGFVFFRPDGQKLHFAMTKKQLRKKGAVIIPPFIVDSFFTEYPAAYVCRKCRKLIMDYDE